MNELGTVAMERLYSTKPPRLIDFLITLRFELVGALERSGRDIDWLPMSARRRPGATSLTLMGKPSLLPSLLRRAILSIGLSLRPTSFQPLVDLHLRHQLDQFLQRLVRNDYLAHMLNLLKGEGLRVLLTLFLKQTWVIPTPFEDYPRVPCACGTNGIDHVSDIGAPGSTVMFVLTRDFHSVLSPSCVAEVSRAPDLP